MVQMVVAFVLSRIDYCNAVLAALPQSTIKPLQRAQNAAARLVFGLRSHDHITPALQLVKKRKLSYYGRVLRKEGNCMKKEIMQGATSGQRRRGRPRTRWQDNITKWIGLTGDRLLRSVEDRSQWRQIIHEAANPRIEDG